MPSNPNGPIRRAQLIAPFGVGSLVVVPGGVSLLVSGLDHWYLRTDLKTQIDPEEFRIEEWRLQNLLRVDHFRLPPDYRDPFYNANIPNTAITIPAFRFPTWHFCPDKSCRLLIQRSVYERGRSGRIKCPDCERKGKTRYLFQVPFVAMCERGHLQDFPWREWVHKSSNPSCQGRLQLLATGSATLQGQKVKCECGADRNLSGIANAETLSKSLSEDGEYLCKGGKPWLGDQEFEDCGAPIRGSLRSASNLYFAQVVSAIYLPRGNEPAIQEIVEKLERFPLSYFVSMNKELGCDDPAMLLQRIKNKYPLELAEYKDEQILIALDIIDKSGQTASSEPQAQNSPVNNQMQFRYEEYIKLHTEREDNLLRIKQVPVVNYSHPIDTYFSRIALIPKLRETRVMAGFTRVFPESDQSRSEQQSLLWRKSPQQLEHKWLPAYIVYGEGVFFELREDLLRYWENKPEVIRRVKPLSDKYNLIQEQKHLQDKEISPRFVLLHTFAHIVMNRLTFECGYSSAALRERLYVSSNPEQPMSGVLIYTADGDSEGTMGGLVRMGNSGNIEPVVLRALENAKWCSADPVCMEMGKHKGQGPDSCNLAACHNCALVPETACEEFNRFLDRGVVVKTLETQSTGFFDILSLLKAK